MLASSHLSDDCKVPSPHFSLMMVTPPVRPPLTALCAAFAAPVFEPPPPVFDVSSGRSSVVELQAMEASARAQTSEEDKKRMCVDMVLCERPLGSHPKQGLPAIRREDLRQWSGKIAATRPWL